MLRRNLIGDSMLAIPLLAQGIPFGVLSLLAEQPRGAHTWNLRLAEGLAQEAALAISNARLYEAAEQRQRGLAARLQQLEHLAETLAHDLKGPGLAWENSHGYWSSRTVVNSMPGRTGGYLLSKRMAGILFNESKES